MFGIGFWEMLVIAGLVLVAVGPDKLPEMLKQLAKYYRQFRRTADEIRSSTGIDQLLRDEELKELADLRKQKLDLLGTSSKSAVKPAASSSVVKPAPKPVVPEKTVAPENAAPKDSAIPPTSSPEAAPQADAIPVAGVPASKSALGSHAKSTVVRGLRTEDREIEYPPIGVDLAEARHTEPPQTRAPMDVPPEHIHPSKLALFKKAGS